MIKNKKNYYYKTYFFMQAKVTMAFQKEMNNHLTIMLVLVKQSIYVKFPFKINSQNTETAYKNLDGKILTKILGWKNGVWDVELKRMHCADN